jgi:NDP-sugar pyrophosphorylase family protein
MCKAVTIFILLLITLNTKGQKLNHELSKLLFDVDLSSLDTNLIASFGKIPSLEKRSRIDTFIIYREKENSSYFYTHSFKFNENKYIKTAFKSGFVDVVKIDTAGNNTVKTRVDIWLDFNTKKDIEKTFNKLVRTFSSLGVSNKRKPSPSNATEELTVINEMENKKLYLLKSNYSFQNVTYRHLTLTISSFY